MSLNIVKNYNKSLDKKIVAVFLILIPLLLVWNTGKMVGSIEGTTRYITQFMQEDENFVNIKFALKGKGRQAYYFMRGEYFYSSPTILSGFGIEPFKDDKTGLSLYYVVLRVIDLYIEDDNLYLIGDIDREYNWYGVITAGTNVELQRVTIESLKNKKAEVEPLFIVNNMQDLEKLLSMIQKDDIVVVFPVFDRAGESISVDGFTKIQRLILRR